MDFCAHGALWIPSANGSGNNSDLLCSRACFHIPSHSLTKHKFKDKILRIANQCQKKISQTLGPSESRTMYSCTGCSPMKLALDPFIPIIHWLLSRRHACVWLFIGYLLHLEYAQLSSLTGRFVLSDQTKMVTPSMSSFLTYAGRHANSSSLVPVEFGTSSIRTFISSNIVKICAFIDKNKQKKMLFYPSRFFYISLYHLYVVGIHLNVGWVIGEF